MSLFIFCIGDNKYIMGNNITEADCAAFGILSQIRWCTPDCCQGHQLLKSLYHEICLTLNTYLMIKTREI